MSNKCSARFFLASWKRRNTHAKTRENSKFVRHYGEYLWLSNHQMHFAAKEIREILWTSWSLRRLSEHPKHTPTPITQWPLLTHFLVSCWSIHTTEGCEEHQPTVSLWKKSYGEAGRSDQYLKKNSFHRKIVKKSFHQKFWYIFLLMFQGISGSASEFNQRSMNPSIYIYI